MVNHVPARAPLTEGVIAWLTAQTAIAGGRGEQPTGTGWQGRPGQDTFVPYWVLHPLAGGGLDGPIGDPHADGQFPFQLNAYGGTQAQAEAVMDRLREALLSKLPAIELDGQAVVAVTCELPAGAARQDQDQPPLWWCFEQHRIATSPL